MSFFDDLKELGEILEEGIEEGKELCTDGFREMVIKGNNDYKTSYEKKRRKEKVGLEFGDIIGVLRGAYEHYAVYIGNNRVIHYSSESSDIGGDNKIIETSFSHFLRRSNEYFILIFPDSYGKPSKSGGSAISFDKGFMPSQDKQERKWNDFIKDINYKLYSPSETVKRAKSRLGEDKYNLIVNNCEHFAIWCKTGISESHQVNKILELLKGNRRTKTY